MKKSSLFDNYRYDYCCCCFWVLSLVYLPSILAKEGPTIAIIGGGISGSFVTKYLTDYDPNCTIASITVYEPHPVQKVSVQKSRNNNDITQESAKNNDTNYHHDWPQGSRVSAIQLEDGTIVEVGASVLYRGFHHVIDMIRNDPTLIHGIPFHTGINETDHNLRPGMGIYNGNGTWPLLITSRSDYYTSMLLLLRYHWDLLKISKLSKQMQTAFATIPTLLNSHQENTFFESPDSIWRAVGLYHAVHMSFDHLLDAAHVSSGISWWKKRMLPFQGSIRDELLQAVNLVNYNQDNAHVNGVVGMGSFAATTGGLFSLVGGNYQVIESAMNQALNASVMSCQHYNDHHQIQQIPKVVTAVVGDFTGLDLYGNEQELLGRYDIVILATPIQFSRIQFFVRSFHDQSILQPMPLAGLLDPDTVATNDGHVLISDPLPDSSKRPYKQVVTTVVSNASLSGEYLHLSQSAVPATILMTPQGKRDLHNITAIRELKSSTKLYKVFSDEVLDEHTLQSLFGPFHAVEFVKKWGGPNGGATPDYQGQGLSTNFLLYDGANGLTGHTNSGALYYPSTMEQSSLSCMELCAVGAKAVAKLVAKRLGLLHPARAGYDEL
jgi:prenylcysteine oxidase / farnesylcysteine lyase